MKKIDGSNKNQKLDLKPDDKFKDWEWRYEKFLSRGLLDYPAKHLLGSWYDEKAENLVALLYLARQLSEEEALAKFKKLGYKGPSYIEEAIARFTDITNFVPCVIAFTFMNYLNEETKKYDKFSKEEAIAKTKQLGYLESDLVIGFTTLFGPEEFSYNALFEEMYSYNEVFEIFKNYFGKENAIAAFGRYVFGDADRIKEDPEELFGWSREDIDAKLKNLSLPDFIRNAFKDFYYESPELLIAALIVLGYPDLIISKAFLELGYEIDPEYLEKIRKEQEKYLEEDYKITYEENI